uniref:Uncharacterized protein n=1 Tax=Zea mays TaxID=4577 RepID=A0A804PY87_MAIZE
MTRAAGRSYSSTHAACHRSSASFMVRDCSSVQSALRHCQPACCATRIDHPHELNFKSGANAEGQRDQDGGREMQGKIPPLTNRRTPSKSKASGAWVSKLLAWLWCGRRCAVGCGVAVLGFVAWRAQMRIEERSGQVGQSVVRPDT